MNAVAILLFLAALALVIVCGARVSFSIYNKLSGGRGE